MIFKRPEFLDAFLCLNSGVAYAYRNREEKNVILFFSEYLWECSDLSNFTRFFQNKQFYAICRNSVLRHCPTEQRPLPAAATSVMEFSESSSLWLSHWHSSPRASATLYSRATRCRALPTDRRQRPILSRPAKRRAGPTRCLAVCLRFKSRRRMQVRNS